MAAPLLIFVFLLKSIVIHWGCFYKIFIFYYNGLWYFVAVRNLSKMKHKANNKNNGKLKEQCFKTRTILSAKR